MPVMSVTNLNKKTTNMEITKLIPSAGRLLVRLIEQPDSDKTGLVMLNGNMTNYLMGEVIATADGHQLDRVASRFPIGTKVLLLKYGIDEVVVAGEKLALVEDINVIATFE